MYIYRYVSLYKTTLFLAPITAKISYCCSIALLLGLLLCSALKKKVSCCFVMIEHTTQWQVSSFCVSLCVFILSTTLCVCVCESTHFFKVCL